DGFPAAVIHGNKSQNARQNALNGFRDGNARILVATDIAARGIDVPGITHVVNFDLPDEPESYVHRIGRTGRNGADGIAVTLCDPAEAAKLRSVERVIRMKLPVVADHTREPDPVRAPGEQPARSEADADSGRREHNGRRNGRPQGHKPQGQRPHGHGQKQHGRNGQPGGQPGGQKRPQGQQQRPRDGAQHHAEQRGGNQPQRRPVEAGGFAGLPGSGSGEGKAFRGRRRGGSGNRTRAA
ncbi:MAG: helicase-related protein, partial [Rhizobiaceae bacterium]